MTKHSNLICATVGIPRGSSDSHQAEAALAAEWGPRGIRVNAVSPGFTRTPALEKAFQVGALSRERMTQAAALGRLVEPNEVAQAIIGRCLLGALRLPRVRPGKIRLLQRSQR
jgi:Enoyl-(Acyl carrier protein) reductase